MLRFCFASFYILRHICLDSTVVHSIHRRKENQPSFKLLLISRMDLLVSGWNFKQFAVPVSPPPPLPPPVSPPSAATTCSFYKPPSSAHKVSSPFRTYRLARISNKSSAPFAIHARKKNSKSKPLLEPTLVEEVSMDDDDKEDELLLFDDFEDGNFMNTTYPFALWVRACWFLFSISAQFGC